MASVCSVDSCDGEVDSRGYCGAHYQRWRKYGDTRAHIPVSRAASHRYNSPHLIPGKIGKEYVPEYVVWNGMKQRCTNENSKDYERYGGAGIAVAPEWVHEGGDGQFSGYTRFVCDMGPRPDGFSLDRMDPSKGYTPENCHWAPGWMQQANTGPTRKLIRKALEADWTLERLANAMGVDTSGVKNRSSEHPA